MHRFFVHVLITACGVAVAGWILPGIHVASWQALLIAAIVLGIVNAIVKPILFILTLPITVLTLGLFYFVVNGLTFALAVRLVPGLSSDSFWWSMAGAFVVGVVSWFAGCGKDETRRRDDD